MLTILYTYHQKGKKLILLLIGLFLLPLLVSASPRCDKLRNEKGVCQNIEPYLSKEFTVNGPGIFEASTFAGNIEVTAILDTNLVRVEIYVERGYSFWSGSKSLDNYRITMKQQGNKIFSSVEKKSDDKGFFSDQVTFSYKVYLPQKMSSMLKTSAGNISIRGLIGEHSIKSYAGNISIKDVQGHVKAYTSGGNIDIEHSRGTLFGHTNGGNIMLDNNKGELRFRSNGGQIIAQRISGTMVSRVNGGNIKAQFTHVSKGVSLTTSAGNIYVELPKDTGFDINLSGSDIKFPYSSNFVGESSKRSVQGKLFGGGLPVNLETDYGTIVLRVDNRQ